MKKMVVLIVLLVGIHSIYAQRNQPNPNIPDWIVGTWVDQEGRQWIFNADGTFTVNNIGTGKYIVVESTLILKISQQYVIGYDIFISKDLKILALFSTFRPIDQYWLEKT